MPDRQPSFPGLALEEPPSALVPDRRVESVGQAQIAYGPAREILMKATGFMEAYDFTLNPYSGCSFGCTYCYAAFFSRSPRTVRTGAAG